MILSPADAKAFFHLWLCLDTFTNQRVGMLPGVETLEQMNSQSIDAMAAVRVRLWKNPALLDEFVRDNPFHLSPGEVADVQAFRLAVQGTFYVERCLKNYAVFVLAGSSPRVFAVHGLSERIDEVLYRSRGLGYAAMVDTVLLPFRGRIVWDGMARLQNVTFGAGIRSGFKDAYLRAKDRNQVVFSLQTGPQEPPLAVKSERRWRPTIESITRQTDALGKTDTQVQQAAFRLLKLGAQIAQMTLDEPADLEGLAASTRKADRALKQLNDAIQRDQYE
jgi:hypothetical protein